MEKRKLLPPFRIDLVIRPSTHASHAQMPPDRPGNRRAYAYARPIVSSPTHPFPDIVLLSMGAMLLSEHAPRPPLSSRQRGKARRYLDNLLLRKLWRGSGVF